MWCRFSIPGPACSTRLRSKRIACSRWRGSSARFGEVHPDVPIIGFPRGAGALYANYRQRDRRNGAGARLDGAAVAGGAAAGSQVRCKAISIRCGWWPAARRLPNGVDAILRALGDGPLIFNLGHGITPEAPVEHVEEMVARVRKELAHE